MSTSLFPWIYLLLLWLLHLNPYLAFPLHVLSSQGPWLVTSNVQNLLTTTLIIRLAIPSCPFTLLFFHLNNVIFTKWHPRLNRFMLWKFPTLVENNTQTLCPWASNLDFVSKKWVFKIKQKLDGSIETFKARLVAKSSYQISAVDYHETSSRLSNLLLCSWCLHSQFLFIGMSSNLMCQMHFFMVFLTEEVYIE